MRRRPRETEFHIEIAPVNLIDLLLVLLVFFIVTTTFLKLEMIRVALPDSRSAVKVVKKEEVTVINVDREGTLYVAGKRMEYEEALEKVKAVKAGDPKRIFQVGADEESRHRDFVRALDLLREAGIEDFAILTEEKEKDAQ